MSVVEKLSVIVLVLCSATAACNRDDTIAIKKWPRLVEPRLTGAKWQPCPASPDEADGDGQCGKPAIATDEACPDVLETHADALALVANRKDCTEDAIAALERFAHADERVWSDVGAAYYLHARRGGPATDLLQALEASERGRQNTPAAHFNRALIEEALGLDDEARSSWTELLKLDRSDWSRDVRAHLHRLDVPDAPAQWKRNRAQLPDALQARNEPRVRDLIQNFPYLALEYFEDEVLAQGDVAAAQTLASALSRRLGGDRYVLDVVQSMSRAQETLSEYHRMRTGAAPPDYEAVAHGLNQNGCPLHLVAEIRNVLLQFTARTTDRGLALLAETERHAREHGYVHLLARIHATRGFLLFRQTRYLESLAAYDAAFVTFRELGDAENMSSIGRSRAGTYRLIGQYELAWREALRAALLRTKTVDPRRRHVILGEAATTALTLGHPRIALRYQSAAIRMLQNRLGAEEPEREQQIKELQYNIAVARSHRAGIEVQLGLYEAAEADLGEALRLARTELTLEPTLRNAARVAMQEALGQSLLTIDPHRAADAFQAALDIIPFDELHTVRAVLHAQLADAARRMGRNAAAEADLQSALAELRKEEIEILKRRRVGEGEQYWSAYFSRFDETYDRLIQYLLGDGRWQKAFDEHERSRAYEPLNLILTRGRAPESFRKLVPRGEPMALSAVQAALPRGTFLVQYRVLNDRTEAWVVSHDGSDHIALRASRDTVRRWSDDVQKAARRRDADAMERVLRPAFDELLAKPLTAIAAMPGGRNPARLVIVPDDAMFGLPFSALHDTRSHRYLIEVAPIEIAGSATLYVYSLLRDAALETRTPSALLIGDPAFDESVELARGLARLDRALAEVEEIRRIYAPHVVVRTGADATAEELFGKAHDTAVVLFAGHAIANANEPWRSVLLFAKSSNHSGVVEAGELVRRLDLDRARLVALSACSSAGGFPFGSQGVAPLVRPLIAAGVPAVMGSLWDVEDATAETVSVSFHRHYGQGSDAGTALQAAQLQLLRSTSPGLQSVLVWAPFQVIGHASSPFAATHKERMEETHLAIHRTHSLQRNDGIRPEQ